MSAGLSHGILDAYTKGRITSTDLLDAYREGSDTEVLRAIDTVLVDLVRFDLERCVPINNLLTIAKLTKSVDTADRVYLLVASSGDIDTIKSAMNKYYVRHIDDIIGGKLTNQHIIVKFLEEAAKGSFTQLVRTAEAAAEMIPGILRDYESGFVTNDRVVDALKILCY